MFNCPVQQVERFQPTLTLCTNVHVVRVTLFELTCLKFRYKNLISWANRRTKAAQEKLDVHWVHPFPSFKRMRQNGNDWVKRKNWKPLFTMAKLVYDGTYRISLIMSQHKRSSWSPWTFQ